VLIIHGHVDKRNSETSPETAKSLFAPETFPRFALRALPNEGGMMHPPIPRVVKFTTALGTSSDPGADGAAVQKPE
jgi:hypothetical protein